MNNLDDLAESNDPQPSALEVAQTKTKAALQVGTEYVRANPVPIFFGALIVGAVLGALLTPRRRQPASPVQSVRDWLESSLDEVSQHLPRVKKQACGLREDVVAQVAELRKKFNL